MTRDTVDRDTPAARATSSRVSFDLSAMRSIPTSDRSAKEDIDGTRPGGATIRFDRRRYLHGGVVVADRRWGVAVIVAGFLNPALSVSAAPAQADPSVAAACGAPTTIPAAGGAPWPAGQVLAANSISTVQTGGS